MASDNGHYLPFCIWILSCSSTTYWKYYPFPINLAPLTKINWPCMWIYFSIFYSVSVIYMSILTLIIYCLVHCNSTVSLEIRYKHPPILYFFSRSFAFPCKFYIQLVNFYNKKPIGTLIRITINLQINLETTDMLTLNILMHNYGISLFIY